MTSQNVTSTSDTAAGDPKRSRPGFASDDKRRKAALLFGYGFGYITTASVLDLNPATVREWARLYRAGKFKPELPRHLYRFNEETKEQAIELRRQGKSWSQIHKATGVSQSTIRRWIKAADEKAAEGAADARSGEGMKTERPV